MSDRRARLQRANSPVGRILRYLGLLVGIAGGWQLGAFVQLRGSGDYGARLLFAAALGALLFLAAPYVTLGFFHWLRQEIRRVSAGDLVAAGIGLLIGGLVSALLAWPISLLPDPFGQVLPTATAIVLCSTAVVTTVTQKRELLGLVGWSGKFAPPREREPADADRHGILLDTSVIIDGRIADIALTGLLVGNLVIPSFVLRELQMVADSSDISRRQRGRRGLDVLDRLQREAQLSLEFVDLDPYEEPDVDGKLVRIAQQCGYRIFTGDQGLERIAALKGVRVININQLAHALRPALIPGEEMKLKIVQPGREYDQGVGFLDDGTMVVVDSGKGFVGQDVDIVVTRTLQTGVGRMAFAHIKDRESA